MSVIAVGGRRYAAGLYWLDRAGPGATARTARRLGRPWCVHRGERTGFAADDPAASPVGAGPADAGPEGPGLAGLPALAPALLELIEGEFWMALIGGDGGGGEGRYALVKARGGAVLADGDELFEDRAAALAAFERARALGWALHATPGLAAELGGEEVAALDVAALDRAASRAGAAIVLGRASAGRGHGRRVLSGAIGVAVLAAVAGLWLGRGLLVEWFAPAPEAAPTALRPEPMVAVSVDGAALILACRQALVERAPFLPGWRIERIACTARFSDPELSRIAPELAGRAVLHVRWRLRPGHGEALQRRVAEAHLAGWYAAAVAGDGAWAAVPLAPVLRIAEEPAPPFLELRRAVDLAFGARGAGVGYARDGQGSWTMRIDDSGPLSSLAARAGGIAGLEITALTRGEDGAWRLEGRPAAPETVPASRLAALGVRGRSPVPGHPRVSRREPPAIAGTIQPEKEAKDGTETHDGP